MNALAATTRFEPIDLTELNERAELQVRVDRKYLVDARVIDQLVEWFDPRLRVLEIEGVRDASYRSVYFDTPDLLSYRQAAWGRRRRFKLRTRAYCDSGVAFLEAKTKGARGITTKARIPHDFARLYSLGPESKQYAAGVMRSVGEADVRVCEIDPILETAYRRMTFLVPQLEGTGDSASRVTIDTDLSWELCNPIMAATEHTMYRPDLAIIETKSGTRPGSTDHLLWRHGIRPVSLSKYATGMAAMNPLLPGNRWARLINRNFHRQESS